jgi:hypothetical protein
MRVPAPCVLICGRGKSNFCIGLRQINPTGKSLPIFRNGVKPQNKKYFCFRPAQISSLIRCLVPPEGRSRVVTSAGRDAVDVKASGAQRQSQGEMNLVSDVRRAG